MYVCMYVYSRGGPHTALAPRPSLIYTCAVINCSYDLRVSNKSIHQSKPRLQVTKTRDNIKTRGYINEALA
jgi:hypothetical protein